MSGLDDDELVERARRARDRAYAPYSGYAVGATLIAGGRAFDGANIENASFSVTMCAERAAIAAAVMAGRQPIEAIAVVTQTSPPAAPCGVCRQALLEFVDDPRAVRVILANLQGEREVTTLAELLPRGFRRSSLPEPPSE